MLRPAGTDDRPGLAALWQMFRHELSDFDHSRPAADGAFGRERLDAALTEPDRELVLIEQDGRVVGFAAVRGLLGPCRVVSAFFVVRTARRAGIGGRAADALLRARPGPWEIPFQQVNAAAVVFWRGVAERAAPGAWHEERRPVPGRPDLPPDVWISLSQPPGTDAHHVPPRSPSRR
ncbi:GNAT family N-acetyltransferase [Streptomyces lonarensis]|uniref:GNAT family N-acetyltransferase n=2 Tax=Streptomyces lonarensis TaxID=700599 RepID=A0A7X6D1V1_9ACTN|nr:GNAT family N-acetyltransferase [Streptomyces lonarensis]